MRNQCSFKPACRACSLVEISQRPEMCASIECASYTPCSKCSNNRKLNDSGQCTVCKKSDEYINDESYGKAADEEAEVDIPVADILSDLQSESLNQEEREMAERRKRAAKSRKNKKEDEITMPGTPPASYSSAQKDYYNNQWDQYTAFFIDPTNLPILHNMIQLEIELNVLSYRIARATGDILDGLEKKRTNTIKNIQALKAMLPDDEARRMSEEETALSKIHDKYVEEAAKRTNGGIRSIFSLPAMALAPVLHHKADLNELLQEAGFNVVGMEEFMRRLKDLPKDPHQIARMFHFPIDQRYAMEGSEDGVDYSKALGDTPDDEDEQFDDVDFGSED